MSSFIALEGPDGSGKSTQAKLLAEEVGARGYDVLLTREPGGSPIGDQIRQILFTLNNKSMHPKTEFLLFSASRAQHVYEVIRPYLDKGGVVISDRYFHSSLAYQGYGHDLDLDTLKQITSFATSDLLPDLILLLDLPVEEGLNRRKSEGKWNRLDDYQLEFHQKVRQGYHAMVDEDPDRWAIVDASQPVERIQMEIRKVVFRHLASVQTLP
ncbi:MAG: dTMP kinase [Chloroflexi bacterium RBG_16_48_8]|nr:MAG: dTMP kinase [Chloroflexi bacterium RBG_16_48_8]